LRLCSHIRSLERTRNLPLLAIAEADDNTRLMRGLEIGVNDYLIRPIDPNELLARVRTQVKKKRYAERLRDNVQMSIEAAITDALTGLHNRRYMESHLGTLAEQAAVRGRPLSILILDIDFFKSINVPMAIPPATRCSRNSPGGSRRRCAASTSPAVTAAKSSSW
jgi:two-component system, cell cycle response regulator